LLGGYGDFSPLLAELQLGPQQSTAFNPMTPQPPPVNYSMMTTQASTTQTTTNYSTTTN
jgi:hypothetical protein